MSEVHEKTSVEFDINQSLSPAEKKAIQPSKPRPIIIITAAIGLICFFLPWIKLDFFGFEFYSIIGLDIPTTADMVGQWSVSFGGNSDGVSVFYTLYFIPLIFATCIVFECLLKIRHIPLMGFGILILMSVLIVSLVYNTGMSGFLNLASIGLYGSLVASSVIVVSKNW